MERLSEAIFNAVIDGTVDHVLVIPAIIGVLQSLFEVQEVGVGERIFIKLMRKVVFACSI